MYQLIDGKKISAEIKEEVKAKVAEYKAQGVEITLAVIQVGNDPASSVYVGNKKKACEFVGIRSLSYELPEETTQEKLLDLVKELNEPNFSSTSSILFKAASVSSTAETSLFLIALCCSIALFFNKSSITSP